MTWSYRRPPRGNLTRLGTGRAHILSDPLVRSDDGAGDLPNGRLLILRHESKHRGPIPINSRRPPFSLLRLARWRLG